jgi:plastocyanin
MHPRAAALRSVVIAASIGVVGCGGNSTASSAPVSSAGGSVATGSLTVDIQNFSFGPRSVTVKVGTKVTWTNKDPAPTNHTATADSGTFDTGRLAPGGSNSYTFTTAGTYSYHCAIHNYMTGTITVVS